MMPRSVAVLAVVFGAAGSVALMLRAGQRTPRFLLVLFVIWLLAPFVALLWALVVSPRWSARARVVLCSVALVIAAVSPAIYGKVIPVAPAGSPNAFVWVIVPPMSWLLMVITMLIVRLSPRRAIADRSAESRRRT